MKDPAADDAGAAPRTTGLLAPAPAPPALHRRRVLALALLAPVAAAGLGACGRGATQAVKGPDPLLALADAARSDAALAAAAVAADPELGTRVDPLRAARTEHATALDAEVARLAGTPRSAAATATATAAPTGVTQAVTLARVREALATSQRAAAALVPDLPAERVGLVASVAACCATYAAVLS